MNKNDAAKFIRYGSIAAFIAAFLGALTLIFAINVKTENLFPWGVILNILVIAALGYGLKKKSRICGSLLSISLLATIITSMIQTKNLGTSFGGLVITFFVCLGTFATFRWHKLSAQE